MRKSLVLALLAGCLGASPAAATITLNFENIGTYGVNSGIGVLNFYNGGTASNGVSGTNFGVSFATNALTLCLNTPGTRCSATSRGGVGDAASAFTAMFFRDGTSTSLSDAAGFTSGISFFYVTDGPSSVQIFDGANGTGNLLSSLTLSANAAGSCDFPYNATFCPFRLINLGFSGTAQSVVFAGAANHLVLDDIALGVAVPEPATWAMMLLGFGALGFTLRRRRRSLALA